MLQYLKPYMKTIKNKWITAPVSLPLSHLHLSIHPSSCFSSIHLSPFTALEQRDKCTFFHHRISQRNPLFLIWLKCFFYFILALSCLVTRLHGFSFIMCVHVGVSTGEGYAYLSRLSETNGEIQFWQCMIICGST